MASKIVLLTPPNTGHRVKDKENREIDPSSRVVFAKEDEIHILQPSTSKASAASPTPSKRSLKRKASKSILKKSSAFLNLPCPPESPQREVTPEPSDPLCDLAYLVYPVSRIIQPDNTRIDASNNKLKEVIEAYCILTARLRAALAGKSKLGDESWPLFQPLRRDKHALADAVVRDLERAVTDNGDEEKEQEQRPLLPSPRNTPKKKKKKDGLNEEQIKYARDICTTAHAVMRFLGFAFSTPAIYQIFTDKQLRSMLTAVLAIPLAEELPSLNARKTCALAIGLLQTQRLPVPILAPAADRIAYALTRGIDGELGKEGKKGSASDGLKAVHDLSLHLPGLFVPAFGKAPHILFHSVLGNLLAPTLTIRTQACHAIGGFAFACASLRGSTRHKGLLEGISEVVKEFIMTPSAQPTSPQKSGSESASPSKSESTSAIFRTLRTTLQATDPHHVAHGPVWALCVLAAFIILLGDELKKDIKLTRVMGAMMGLALRHKRSAVRGLACMVWRSFMWIYIGEEDEDEEREDVEPVGQGMSASGALWNLIQSVTELETGICTIAALLNPALDSAPGDELKASTWIKREDHLRKSLDILDSMVIKDTNTCGQALDVMKILTGVQATASKWDKWRKGLRNPSYVILTDKDSNRPSLLPQGLFSAYPGILSAEWKGLSGDVNVVYEETWKADDIRVLEITDFSLASKAPNTDKELGSWKGSWLWEGLVKSWKAILGSKGMWESYSSSIVGEYGSGHVASYGKGKEWKDGLWKDLVAVWGGLTCLCLGSLKVADELCDDMASSFAARAADVIVEAILQNQDLDLTLAQKRWRNEKPVLKKSILQADDEETTPSGQRLEFARDLWATMRDVLPTPSVREAGSKLLLALMQNADDFINFTTVENGVTTITCNKSVEAWATFCIDILAVCGPENVRSFWGYRDVDGECLWQWRWAAEERRCVWRAFSEKWLNIVGNAEWEGAVALLGVPFASDTTFELTKDDVVTWQALLEHTVARAMDYGYDAHTVLSSLATTISVAAQIPTSAAACVHFLEMVLTYATEPESQLQELPAIVLELLNDTMRAAYPPAAKEKMRYLWVVRAITDILRDAAAPAFKNMLRSIGESVALWTQDEHMAWEAGDLDYDIIPLYEVVLVGLQGIPLEVSILETFGTVIASPFAGRDTIQAAVMEPFRDFWNATFAQLEVPAGGWPEDVRTCLQAAFGMESTEAGEESPNATNIEVPLSPEIPVFIRPTTPTTPSTLSTFSSPTTPSRSRKPSTALFSHPSPYSPVSSRRDQTPRRTPFYTPGRESPSKRRRLEGDKENMSPASKYVFRPVMERIAMQSPQKPSTLGKRRAYDEPAAECPSPLKKGKRCDEDDEVQESEDEREVLTVLFSNPIPALFLEPELPIESSPRKKRKRSVFDAVELPRLRELLRLRPAVSFDSATHIPRTPVHTRTFKSNHSAPKARATSKKCGQVDDVFSAPSSDDALSSDPFVLYPKNKPIPLHLSSDDDPHLGQVTPHHVVSPVPQKSRARSLYDCDLSSDEPSPTKDVVERKLKRMASFTTLDNITPKLVKVKSWT